MMEKQNNRFGHRACRIFVQAERRVKTVTELVEVPSFELCRGAAKDIQVPEPLLLRFGASFKAYALRGIFAFPR